MNIETRIVRSANVENSSSCPIHTGVTTEGVYSRDHNETVAVLERALAALEGGDRALVTASGMAAISHAIISQLDAGDKVVIHRCAYLSSLLFVHSALKRIGMHPVPCDLRDMQALEHSIEGGAKLVYFEPLTNPNLDVLDISAIAGVAHAAGAIVMVDNTFLTPLLCRPLEHGADIVVHSATKYFSGHGDALGGVIVTDSKRAERIGRYREVLGGVASPFNAFLILRGLKTLHLRMERQCANAAAVAAMLANHPAVAEVRYPGIESNAGHKIAAHQFSRGFGGIVGFVPRGGLDAGVAFISNLRMCRPWVSLGDVETLAVCCREGDPPNGIPEGYVRLSIGIEHRDDIIADISQALGGNPPA